MRYAVRVALLALAMSACGGNSSSSNGPNVDSAKKLVNLSTSDQQVLCDWLAQREGGYGHVIQCEASGIPLYASADQASCIAEISQASNFPGCQATVGQDVTCAEWFLSNWCASTPVTLPAECALIQDQCYSGGAPPDGGAD